MQPAYEASTAAAGAMIFIERAVEEFKTLTTLPMQAGLDYTVTASSDVHDKASNPIAAGHESVLDSVEC